MTEDRTTSEICIKPLVSIVLICFNQERFIEQAVHSVISQDYPNLEIIISDDCSTDKTYSIAKQVASNNTEHKLFIYSNIKNLGLIGNFKEALNKANGDLVVIASGDDVSKPERVSRIYKSWIENNKPDILSSSYTLINEDGAHLHNRVETQSGNFNSGPIFNKKYLYFFCGATAAYSKSFLQSLHIPEGYDGAEDVALLYQAELEGRSSMDISESLVYYRTHQDSMSHAKFLTIYDQEIYSLRSWSWLFSSLKLLQLNSYPKYSKSTINYTELERLLSHYYIRKNWDKSNIFERLKALKLCKNKDEYKWVIPRIFGIRFFARFKVLFL
ncbi:glycosyltransferase [Sphingomonas aurantiaca]|uniref:glycosyltransferase family 2 protein n=1 Tax=Sphingomonas aurantiaca TaxID=185949 RepID=UPI002FE2EEE3